jgi:archaellum biogenesis ATPase FlaH
MVVESAIGTGVVFKLLDAPIKDLYSKAKEVFGDAYALKLNARSFSKIERSLRNVSLIKTLWQTNEEIDLKSIYYPTKLDVGDGRVVEVGHVNKLPDYNGLLIEGTVGQGKSTFMRYLVYSVANYGHNIPVFLEFRHIQKDETLLQAILRTMNVFGFEVSDELLDNYLSSGKIILFLDGFDELSGKKVELILSELSDLRIKYTEELKIIVSSRPDEAISKLPLFRSFKIKPIPKTEVRNFLDRIIKNKDRLDNLIVDLEDAEESVKELLTTPLMLTLLSTVYIAYNRIPDSFSQFYDCLFMAMYRDHDECKAGFNRERSLQLDPSEVEEIFCVFCFIVTTKQEYSYSESDIKKIIMQAVDKCSFKFSPTDVLSDLVGVACLLVKDGNQFGFIHKSVCEYYSAKYIKSRDVDFKKLFFSKMTKSAAVIHRSVLIFLSEIDRVNYYKLFLKDYLASYRELIKITSNEGGCEGLIESCWSNIKFIVDVEAKSYHGITGSNGFFHPVVGNYVNILLLVESKVFSGPELDRLLYSTTDIIPEKEYELEEDGKIYQLKQYSGSDVGKALGPDVLQKLIRATGKAIHSLDQEIIRVDEALNKEKQQVTLLDGLL